MKLEQLEKAIADVKKCPLGHKDPDVVVLVHSPGSIGGSPAVGIKSIEAGIDWDAGRVIIRTESSLTRLSAEQVADISKSVSKGSSWHAYQLEKARLETIKKMQDLLISATALLEQMTSTDSKLSDQADMLLQNIKTTLAESPIKIATSSGS
ncbi:hypothetical protein ACI2KR_30410 [Pseudomonas luteola]